MNPQAPFKWQHYKSKIILQCVRWYLSSSLSYRQVAEMVNEWGLDIHHTTVKSWVQEYSPEIDQRLRSHLRRANDSWRVDETYMVVNPGKQKYLYRAVDSQGESLDFLLTAKRDAKAAKWFFNKTLKAIHSSTSRVITADKNPCYPKAIKELKAAKKLPKEVKLRQIKYFNNIVEQDHPWLKRLIKPGIGFGSFNRARRTIRGYEIMNMMRKGGKVKFWELLSRLSKSGLSSSTKSLEWLHNLNPYNRGFLSSQSFCNTTVIFVTHIISIPRFLDARLSLSS